MLIPKKISPDRIRESLVQFSYGIDIPYIPSIGYFHSILANRGYEFATKNDSNTDDKQQLISLEQVFVNYDDKIKIEINPNQTLTFNCSEGYIGWDKYNQKIGEIINSLFNIGLITHINRIGVRYISEFPEINIFEIISLKYEFPLVNLDVNNNISFRFEENDNENDIKIINIHSNKKIGNGFLNESNNTILASIIDVDVIRKDIKLKDSNDVMNTLNKIHDKEKYVFFNILKEEFLQTLKPEY